MKREDTSGKNVMLMAVIGGVVILAVFLLGTVWSVNTAARETNDAVRSVSLLYLDELAGRREQVVASNLQRSIDDMGVAIELMDENEQKPESHNPYDMSLPEAQEYVAKRGFDYAWNDGDVFVDERFLTQTVGNVLRWGDDHPEVKKQ